MNYNQNWRSSGLAGLDRNKVRNVILIGGTGSGKTTVGPKLSSLLGFGYVDLDELIENRAGKSIADVFAKDGEDAFRDLEKATIEDLLNMRNHVISVGGGAIESEFNWSCFEKLGCIVWLQSPALEVVRRLSMKPDELSKRPLLAGAIDIEDREEREKFLQEKIQNLMDKRSAFYHKADIALTCSYTTPEGCAQLIRTKLLSFLENQE